jgi:hypothetical protein
VFDLTHASVVALRLRENYARGNGKKHLKKLPEADADLLWKCLLRAGWWFPEFWKPDYATGKERLVWWLNQGDDSPSEPLSDDPKVDEFKINHLTDAHAKILLLRKMAEFPLTELSALRVLQSIVWASRNIDWLKTPLWFSWRIGDWPEDQFGDWHYEFCIKFDAEILYKSYEKSSNVLDHWCENLREWDILEPTDLNSAVNILNRTKRHVKLWLNQLQREWTNFCFVGEELVDGWEPECVQYLGRIGSEPDGYLEFPGQPIRDIDGLREWIEEWLRRVNTINRGAKISKNSMLSCVKRQLRNSRRSLRAWDLSIPAGFNDRPADFFEAERQLERLVDSLTPSAVVTVEERQIDAAAEQSEPELRDAQSPHLKPCVAKAYSQYKKAMEEKPELKTDREAYDWYEENLEDDEKLPSFTTWTKYLRTARNAFDAQKNKRGLGVETRSIVRLKTGNRTKADRL